MTPSDHIAKLNSMYEKTRYRLIRYGDFHPDMKADCTFLIKDADHIVTSAVIDDITILMECYRKIVNDILGAIP